MEMDESGEEGKGWERGDLQELECGGEVAAVV